ncbi:MAG TPA: DUF255 domain-containing protein [Flavobacteriaceae bacterium]|nr:DUF255 domain-containing protein [Flavobacteriaceae bacterium]MCB9214083.1 DUF255 domain-containing protein [Alteromonas sp.]HQU21800.1 DUF255 domain-containing protein [Flavobacteriaceae bacterium]
MKKIQQVLFLATALFVGITLSAQDSIQWMSFSELEVAMDQQPKKVLVFVETDWCGWCRKMKNESFKDADVINYVNKNYYPVILNGEEKETITYRGRAYKWKPSGRRGANELAIELLNGRMGYPTIIFLNESEQILQTLPGYKDAKMFYKIITFFGGDHFKDTTWENYQEQFNAKNTP